MNGELGLVSNNVKLSDDFATIADVPIQSEANRVNPNQVASGIQRGAQVVPGADGKPQVLMGNQQTFGNGFYVAKTNIDVITNTDPAQLAFNSNQNTFKIAKTVLGTYTVTAADATAEYVDFSVAHNLGFAPTVVGSFSTTADGARRQLPYLYQVRATNYYLAAETSSASVEIYSIDNTNINLAIRIFDILGLSWFLAGSIFNFKFYCQQETIVSS